VITIEGTIEEIIFRNEANGYTVCDIRSGKEIVTAVGYMPFINSGESIKACGRWVNHPDYGEQFKVETYEKILPETADAIEKYLASGIVKGVGPVTAAKIVEKFGAATLDIIHNEPERLAEIKGISLSKAYAIGQALDEQRELRKVVMFLQEYGISPSACVKIYRAYGSMAVSKIKENPYRLCEDLFGIGFRTADRIAMRLGIDPISEFRIKSGIKYILSYAAADGHTYLPEALLKERACSLLDTEIPDIEDALVSLVFEKAVIMEKSPESNNVYLAPFFHAEQNVCKRLAELSQASFSMRLYDFEDKLRKLEEEEGIELAGKQKEAIREAMTSGVLVITGGPGTGKTTIIKTIIKLLSGEGHKISLAAPTGRAAKRMTEATGFEARTIHRLLEIGYTGDENELLFQRNENNPIEADAIIIDEMSMVDILLMNHLLKAVPPGARLILVGDVDQLPSVGPGCVLGDIIKCGLVKTVRLTEIFRQAEESMIIVNAHKINNGEFPVLNEKDKDFFFVQRKNLDAIVQTVVDLCCRRLPDTYGFDPMKDIQVLSPSRKSPAGVISLNTELQKALNPQESKKAEKAFRDFVFREGDRVMQIKNNYSLRWEKPGDKFVDGTGVFNGDVGRIIKIDDEAQMIEVLFDDEKLVEYDFSILDEIEPAYAITIHKSQGSEFPVVVMPVFAGPPVLMTSNLLYTAVTRAKKMVVLVGDENSLKNMVDNRRETMRFSGLLEKLKKCRELTI